MHAVWSNVQIFAIEIFLWQESHLLKMSFQTTIQNKHKEIKLKNWDQWLQVEKLKGIQHSDKKLDLGSNGSA